MVMVINCCSRQYKKHQYMQPSASPQLAVSSIHESDAAPLKPSGWLQLHPGAYHEHLANLFANHGGTANTLGQGFFSH